MQDVQVGDRIDQHHDRRGVIALAVVAVLLAAGLVAVAVWPEPPRPAPASPVAAVVEYDPVDCASGRVVPDQGQREIASEGYVPPAEAVIASGSRVTVTVQGTAGRAVVLQSARVEVVRSLPAPVGLFLRAGCASKVPPRYFRVDLDRSEPRLVAEPDTPDFPYRVDQADPEQLIVTTKVTTALVEWRLRLAWTSGEESGELVLDDHGLPFRTTAVTGSRELCLDGEAMWRSDCS
ncbi:hypothetical protein [Umezawaea sp.]|uniref:hypothetical protein n=1 Tax=Umezawaea sp. TaxID=1955258 RepID=UPI002ED3FD1A